MLKEKISRCYLHVTARNKNKKLQRSTDSNKEDSGKDIKEVVNLCEVNCRFSFSGNFVYLTKVSVHQWRKHKNII